MANHLAKTCRNVRIFYDNSSSCVYRGAEHRLSASADVRGLIETVESSLQTVLEPSKFTSWLLDEDEAETDGMAIDQQHLDSDLLERRQQEMAAIRQIFIPHVVFALHQLLFDTRIIVPKNLWKSLDIAILVASEEQRLYKEFLPLNDGSSYSAQNNRLPQLLERMRASQIELLEAQTEA